MESNIKKYYENNWKIENNGDRNDFRIKKIFKLINKFKFTKILDVGCGCGDFTSLFHKAGLDITGVDISSTKLNFSKETNPGPKYIVHDFEHKKLDKKYDLIYSFSVIEHVYDFHSFLDNCYDSLEDGGYLCISTPNVLAFRRRLKFFFGMNTRLASVEHIHFFDPHSFKEALEKHNFKCIRLSGTGKLSWLGVNFSGNIFAIAKK